jgi:hypothetical protein
MAHDDRMMRALHSAIPLALVSLAVAGCGVTSHARDSARNATAAFSPCPHMQATRRTPTNRAHVPAIVPMDPIAGKLCVYSMEGAKTSPAVLRWIARLSEARARTVALLVDTRGGRGPSCDVGFPVLVQLSYRTGRVFSGLAAGCDPELLSTQTATKVFSPTASLAVGGLLDRPFNPGGHVTRVFDYIGQPLASAATAARRHLKAAGEVHVTLDELVDPGAPFEQVVWQTPLPGTEQDAASGSIGLVVATHHASRCRADQLLGRYANGGNGTGDHFGNIDLLNTSAQACSLKGRLTLRGIGADGRPDTNSVSEPVGPTLVLSPRTTLRMLEHDPAAALIVTFGFAGDARDDPQAANGLCYDHETTPKAWALTLNTGATLRIPNGAPGEGGPFYSCHGSLFFGLSPGVQLRAS